MQNLDMLVPSAIDAIQQVEAVSVVFDRLLDNFTSCTVPAGCTSV